ncbi:hypothetical protein ACS0TY_020521 [Phlomoides rotata]
MAVVLLKLVFSTLSALSNMITRLIFTTAAHVVVQMIQALKIPCKNSQRVLDQVKDMMRTCLEYLLDLIIKAITTVLSSLFDLVKEGVLNSSYGLVAAVTGLVVMSKTSLDDAVKDVPEVLEAFTDMVGKIVADLWNNCNDALAYVKDNVLK